jgi:hypothetical protein
LFRATRIDILLPHVFHFFIFASLADSVPPLKEWLGPAHAWIDLLADQSPQGLEVVRGAADVGLGPLTWTAARAGVEGGAMRVTHDLTQEEIAQLVGASRETVNKSLADFAHRGWIKLEGKSVLICDSERLARRAR